MLKTIIDFVNSILLDLAKQRWIKRLLGPLLPDIGFLDLANPHLRVYLALQDMKGPSFHLLNKRADGYSGYEKDLREDLLKQVPDSGVLFDVGSNIGLIGFWTALARPSARVFCFEPEPLNFLILNKTKTYNRIANVDLIPLGLSETPGLQTFFIDVENHGGHSLDETQVVGRSLPSSITVSTVDIMASQTGISRLDAIKIDVQGLELSVLKGARESIEKFKPVLVVEFMFNDKFNDELVAFFKSLKTVYSFREPGETQLHNIDDLKDVTVKKKNQGYFYGDFFFVPAR